MSSKVGRNDPCPCGSGIKYKKCHFGEYDSHTVMAQFLPEWPLIDCLVSDDFEDSGIATVFVVRKNLANGRLVLAIFLCDMYCLGIKNAVFEPDATQSQYDQMLGLQIQDFEPIDYEDARNLVLGAAFYAESLGFEPRPDVIDEYKRAKATIEGDKPFDKDAYEYGLDGEPYYVTGPDDDYAKVFATLERVCGVGGFDYEINPLSGFVYTPSNPSKSRAGGKPRA